MTSDRRLLILYGSETGYAQETAERIRREARKRSFLVELMPMDEYNIANLPTEKLVALVCSVTGQGEEPTNMKRFWRYLLKKSLQADSLSQVSFGVFGQGDSSYKKFNFPAKKLHKRMLQLGAKAIVFRGDGDDQHYLGVDGALDPWLEAWWDAALKLFPLPVGKEIIPDELLPDSTYSVQILPKKDTSQTYFKGSYEGRILKNKRLTQDKHFQDTRAIEITFEDSVPYNSGDSAMIYPFNTPERVDAALKRLNFAIDPDSLIQFSPNTSDEVPEYFKSPISLRNLCEHHLDLFGRPRRYFFQLLSYFATDELQKEKLNELGSSEGLDQLYAYCYRPKRNIYEILCDFPAISIPIRYIPDLIPAMRPRYFSISSAPSEYPKKIELTVAIVHFKTSLSVPRVGVCTNYLSKVQAGDSIRISIAPGNFKIPSHQTPIICISPGTGIAPMRSILRDRFLDPESAESLLFFGCRSKSADFYYELEWTEAMRSSKFKIVTAFSRDQEDKIYVQHKLYEHAKDIWKLITRGATIFLSGNSKQMPDDVRETLVKIILEVGNMQEEDAKKYFEKLVKQSRYQEECWS